MMTEKGKRAAYTLEFKLDSAVLLAGAKTVRCNFMLNKGGEGNGACQDSAGATYTLAVAGG